MRIAHVTDVYLPRLGGVELQVRDLATRQARAGHAPFVVTATPKPSQEQIPAVRIGAPGFGPYRAVRDEDLCRVLRSRRAEVVHAHVSAFSPLAWSAARLAGAHGVPTVVSVHSMWHDVAPLMRWYARRRGAARWPVEWAAVSTAAAAAVRDTLDGTPVAVLPNGIDPHAWRSPPAAGRDPLPTLVSVMRMVRRKRPHPLLRALFALHHAHPGRFRAILVGDGPLLPRLRATVAAAGLTSAISLTGALPRHDIRALLAAADLYLAPAPRESFGIAALEARCAGLPVVARQGSGVADFIDHGVDGWLVSSDAELISTVSRLLTSPSLLATVAAHNRAVVPALNWDTVLTAAEERYAAAARLQPGLVRV